MVIPDGANSTRQLRVPAILFTAVTAGFLTGSAALGYFTFDYINLRHVRQALYAANNENQGLKGEARILERNLDEVRRSLSRISDYTSKLGELTQVNLKKVSKKTGIGPLSKEELDQSQIKAAATGTDTYMPLGINLEKLIFKPVFNKIQGVGEQANRQALELQHLLSNLSQQKSLLSSIPSIRPVNGWITSGYGYRVSPFTGNKTMHKGMDIAAPTGTPIHAPASGVVIFSGKKAGFGNFVMIAHGYGVVTRYGHNHQNMVQPGQKIARGDVIGTVGMSGRTTGPHLHYEILVDGKHDNPRKFILDLQDFAVR